MNRTFTLCAVLLLPFCLFSQQPKDSASTNGNILKIDSAEETTDAEIPVVQLNENDVTDDGSSPNISSALNSSRDAFYSATAYVFSRARFRIRGYDNNNFVTYLNGMPTNELQNGVTPYGQWSGLNDAFRNTCDCVLGLQSNSFAFGGVGGAKNFDTRAANQRPGLKVGYSNTNGNYRHRLMATYSTGILKHGWAVSASVSRRWASEGYVPGTFYDGTSYFLAVQKFFGSNHSLNLTMLGASVRSGAAAPALKEMMDLAGSHYTNRYWGWQDGKKRNGIISNNFLPMTILTHEWKMNNHETMVTAAGFTFGKRERTDVEMYNAPTPRVDYYKFLPSYQEDSVMRILVANEFRTDENRRQADWAGRYEANALGFDSLKNANGIAGNTVYGKRAHYIQSNRIQDAKKFSFASTYNNNISNHVEFATGITYQFERAENYKVVQDLLGADFYVDVNQFAERDFPDSFSVAQNDVNHPNRVVHVGDKFDYDYFTTTHKGGLWAQGVFKFNRVDFFLAGEFSVTGFWRDGKTRYGLAQDISYGRSAVKIFPNGGVKGGITYKIDGKNYLYLNGAFDNRAPFINDAFVSIRHRNSLPNDLKSETIYSGELGYNYRSANVKFKADMFFTQFNNKTKTSTFYHDDFRTNVDMTLTGINTRHWGGEVALEAKVYRGFSVTAVGSFARYTYVSRPTATITYDNNPSLSSIQKVYMKNFNVAGTPQLATTFGINYRSPQFWFASVNFNYYDWMWIDVNPLRRTEAAVDLVAPESQNYRNIIDQERFKGQFTMDLSVGYSWMLNNQFHNLKKRYYLTFNASVSNVTNNKNLIVGGFEQLRFDYQEKNPYKFDSKYFYAYGTTYFINVSFRMQ
jgi:hypothetical protein